MEAVERRDGGDLALQVRSLTAGSTTGKTLTRPCRAVAGSRSQATHSPTPATVSWASPAV